MMYKITIKGTVQGVGFRPFLYRKAKEMGVKGGARNTGRGVEVIVDDKDFLEALEDAPPLAEIEDVSVKKIEPDETFEGFRIFESEGSGGEIYTPPDIYVCDRCLDELVDKADRRHGYYFITCTDCGPRFSMIENFKEPYDRPMTTMGDFEMCDECSREYTSPEDRRFHAQTIACKKCGPKLRLYDGEKVLAEGNSAIERACNLIKEGEIVAVKGNGGFHLICLTDPETVAKLRRSTTRKKQPYALMAKDVEMIERYCEVSEMERRVLESPEAPITILVKHDRESLKEVCELDNLGFMLPYTGLHHLIFNYIEEPLVDTSANMPGLPLSITMDEARKLTNYLLTHERRIANRCDDSVVKVIGGRRVLLRRSRGFVPKSLNLEGEGILAIGAELDNTITVVNNDKAYISQHIGDVENQEVIEQLKRVVGTFLEISGAEVNTVLCDLHPDFETTRLASKYSEKFEARLVQVQHHLAHAASVAAENDLENFVGIVCDGFGYGRDGTAWGGEVFKDERRVGSLEEQPMIGGDSATEFPKKMLFGILSKFLDKNELVDENLFDRRKARAWHNQLEEDFGIFQTTSTGRVLDSVAALLGLCERRYYEGRPAMLLESLARNSNPYEFAPVVEERGGKERKIELKTTPLIQFIYDNINKNKKKLAATAHYYLSKGLYQIARRVRDDEEIVFSGGVAYNSLITPWMLRKGVLINAEVPCGDGGTSFGQAAYYSLFLEN